MQKVDIKRYITKSVAEQDLVFPISSFDSYMILKQNFIQQTPCMHGTAGENKVSTFLELTFQWRSQATVPVNSSHVSVLEKVRW